MENRRQQIRISKSLEVKYKIADGFLKSGARSFDISKGGIRLPTIQRLRPGTILELEIKLSEVADPIIAIGEVMWLSPRKQGEYPFEVGVKFIDIAPIDSEALRNLCKDIEKKE